MEEKKDRKLRRKYTPDFLVPMFRKAAALRNDMLDAGFTDNGWAIHSAERILDMLGLYLNYRELPHINSLRKAPNAIFSVEALKLHKDGNKVRIEHVSPRRHLTQMAIDRIGQKVTDAQFKEFVQQHYKLVLLSPEEATALDKKNRSKVDPNRLDGIAFPTREST